MRRSFFTSSLRQNIPSFFQWSVAQHPFFRIRGHQPPSLTFGECFRGSLLSSTDSNQVTDASTAFMFFFHLFPVSFLWSSLKNGLCGRTRSTRYPYRVHRRRLLELFIEFIEKRLGQRFQSPFGKRERDSLTMLGKRIAESSLSVAILPDDNWQAWLICVLRELSLALSEV